MSAVSAITNKLRCFFLLFVAIACLVLLPSLSFGDVPNEQKEESKPTPAKLNKLTRKKGPAAGNGNDNGDASLNIDVVALFALDEDGRNLRRPGSLFYDSETGETYITTNTGNGPKAVVYGPDFFPGTSLGRGRGVDNLASVYIDKEGLIYICQSATEEHPAQINVYNQAFFPVRSITFEGLPDLDFQPRTMAINKSDELYVVGRGARGVAVFSKEGVFSRWIRPLDLIFDEAAIEAAEAFEQEEEGGSEAAGDDDPQESGIDISGLPPELLPQASPKDYPSEESGPATGFVQVSDVHLDSNGNIYCLSIETGKVYVYNPAEEYLFSFGEKGGSSGKLSRPIGLVIDEQKRAIFIADAMRHTILIYDMSGRFMYEFGGRGYSPGWFQFPSDIALTNDNNLLVSDRFNDRIQVLDVNFQYRFPLFQVPFVEEHRYKPMPMAKNQKRYYAPAGFGPGEQASNLEAAGKLYEKFKDGVM